MEQMQSELYLIKSNDLLGFAKFEQTKESEPQKKQFSYTDEIVPLYKDLI
jgi:hypothetical protein